MRVEEWRGSIQGKRKNIKERWEEESDERILEKLASAQWGSLVGRTAEHVTTYVYLQVSDLIYQQEDYIKDGPRRGISPTC